jgi:hypothetical protein
LVEFAFDCFAPRSIRQHIERKADEQPPAPTFERLSGVNPLRWRSVVRSAFLA